MVPTRQKTSGDESISSLSKYKNPTAICYGYNNYDDEENAERGKLSEIQRESEKKVTLAGESKHSGNQSHICPVENYVLI